jgi:hypothetical protein
MGKLHDILTPELHAFIQSQSLFFVASAPSGPEGHVNLSPKGMDTFRVLSPKSVAYLDLTGSGNETASHVTQNGRLTIMFCAFEGRPMILRLYAAATLVLPDSAAWADLSRHFPQLPGARQIVLADVRRIQTSCGFGVPLMTFTEHRDLLPKWAATKGPDGLREYRRQKNLTSIDGLPTS